MKTKKTPKKQLEKNNKYWFVLCLILLVVGVVVGMRIGKETCEPYQEQVPVWTLKYTCQASEVDSVFILETNYTNYTRYSDELRELENQIWFKENCEVIK